MRATRAAHGGASAAGTLDPALVLERWPGTWWTRTRPWGPFALLVQVLLLACAYWLTGGSRYPWFWPIAGTVLFNQYFLSWAIGSAASRFLPLTTSLDAYLGPAADGARSMIDRARDRRANRRIGAAFAGALVVFFLAFGALPGDSTGLLLSTAIGPCLYVAAEAFFQLLSLAALVRFVSSREPHAFDPWRPSRTPALIGLRRLHAFAVTCFFVATVVFVFGYVMASAAFIAPAALDSPMYAGSWIVMCFFIICLPITSVLPRIQLGRRVEELEHRATRQFLDARVRILGDPEVTLTDKLCAAEAVESSVRSIADGRDTRMSLEWAIALCAELASIAALLLALPDSIRHLFSS